MARVSSFILTAYEQCLRGVGNSVLARIFLFLKYFEETGEVSEVPLRTLNPFRKNSPESP